jgi:hypothetical protein
MQRLLTISVLLEVVQAVFIALAYISKIAFRVLGVVPCKH